MSPRLLQEWRYVGPSWVLCCACADPGNWQVPPYVAADFANTFLYERAQIAQAQNKPWILEETGKDVGGLLFLFTALHMDATSCARPANAHPHLSAWPLNSDGS